MSADDEDTERIAQAEKSRDEAWAAYRKAIGVPPSQHQRERLEQMALAREESLQEVAHLRRRIDDHEAQIRDLLEEREELLTEIRRLRMGNHPAGRALLAPIIALSEALTERDAEHEGGGGA